MIQKYKEMQRLSNPASSNTITPSCPTWCEAHRPYLTCQCIIFYLVLSRNLNLRFWWFKFYLIESQNFPPTEYDHVDFWDNNKALCQLSQKCLCQDAWESGLILIGLLSYRKCIIIHFCYHIIQTLSKSVNHVEASVTQIMDTSFIHQSRRARLVFP